MISTWRNRRANYNGKIKKQPEHEHEHEPDMELTTPVHFQCPISLDLMKDPVTLPTGITFDRENIEKWIESGNQTCPVTKQMLRSLDLIPNHTLRRMIQDWCVENYRYGIERIPTPRIPVTGIQATEILSGITAASQRGDQTRCRNLIEKIKNLVKESDRNRKCFISNGVESVLSSTFDTFAAATSFEKHSEVLRDLLSILASIFPPHDSQSMSLLGSPTSLHCLVWFLKSDDLSGRRNSVLVLKNLLSSDPPRHVHALANIQGAIQVLFDLIKKPICPKSTKASLITIFYLVSSSCSSSSSATDKIKSRFVEMGLVSLLLEILVESEKSICEKALAVLDGICDCEQGREKAYGHALTMPLLVKKLLRVSNLATEFVVSILWKLCNNDKRKEGNVVVEALQVGAFQKLVLLIQFDFGDKTKKKATKVLKLLNLYRGRSECIDSMDFKELKR